MSWNDHMVGGFVATAALTTALSASRGLRWTRMDIPFMLGTALTSDRDRAKWMGFAAHLINGWIFTFIYFAIFSQFQLSPLLLGGILGLFHALFILIVGMAILPSMHPRMASEHHGPDPTRLLEPPGFLALHYGKKTPQVTLVAHVLYGIALGLFFNH